MSVKKLNFYFTMQDFGNFVFDYDLQELDLYIDICFYKLVSQC